MSSEEHSDCDSCTDFNGRLWGLKLDGGSGTHALDLPEGVILLITGVCVDVNAKNGERAVLTLQSQNEGDETEYTLASLNPGVEENVALDIPVLGSVILRNKGGKGTTIHVIGRFVTADGESDEEDDFDISAPAKKGQRNGFIEMESEEESEEFDLEDKELESEANAGKHGKAAVDSGIVHSPQIKKKSENAVNGKKEQKIVEVEDEEEDDEEDEDFTLDDEDDENDEDEDEDEDMEDDAEEAEEDAEAEKDEEDDSSPEEDEDNDMEKLINNAFPGRTGKVTTPSKPAVSSKENKAASTNKRKQAAEAAKQQAVTPIKKSKISEADQQTSTKKDSAKKDSARKDSAKKQGPPSKDELGEKIKSWISASTGKELTLNDLGGKIHEEWKLSFKDLNVGHKKLNQYLASVKSLKVGQGKVKLAA